MTDKESHKMNKLSKQLSIVTFLILLPIAGMWAQSARIQKSAAFEQKEVMKYKVSFKWGLLRGKLADVTLTTEPISNGQYFSQLTMRTTGMAETFYPMRDTLETLYGANKLPRRFEKRINDNEYRAQDVITFNYTGNKARVHSKQTVNGKLEIDTIVTLSGADAEVLDLLSTLAILRTYDFVNTGNVLPMKVLIPLGAEKHLVEYVFDGIETVQMPDGTKRQAMKISLNTNEKSFKKNRNSVTVWITRDKEQVPVKIVSEISVGVAAIDLVSYTKR